MFESYATSILNNAGITEKTKIDILTNTLIETSTK